jgi:SsrA-binding protein
MTRNLKGRSKTITPTTAKPFYVQSWKKTSKSSSARIEMLLSMSRSMSTMTTSKKTVKSKNKSNPQKRVIALNRVARHQYHILDTYEAGIALVGTEVKSIRDGKLNLRDGYIKSDGRTCTLLNVHIGKYERTGNYFQHDERRPRQLLLHEYEARKLYQSTNLQPGMTIVPLRAYLNDDNRIKIEIALCRGKNVRDKRADIQERDAKREAQRIIKSFRVM